MRRRPCPLCGQLVMQSAPPAPCASAGPAGGLHFLSALRVWLHGTADQIQDRLEEMARSARDEAAQPLPGLD